MRNLKMGAVLSKWKPPIQNRRVQTYAYWLAKDISSDCSLNLVLGHNLDFTKDMFSVFLYLEMEMERPNKEKSNSGRITTYQNQKQFSFYSQNYS